MGTTLCFSIPGAPLQFSLMPANTFLRIDKKEVERMKFEFATAGQIVFGPGAAMQIGNLAAGLGRHVMVVTGKTSARADFIFPIFKEHSLQSTRFNVTEEPTTSIIEAGVDMARGSGCDVVIGIGGGSVIDSGKAIAALLTNRGNLNDYLEVIGKGQTIEKAPAPYIAVPTTAGTGAEVTRNSVLMSPEHKVKVSMRSVLMLPRMAIVDPELTHSMPPFVTAYTGLDAFTQLLEAFVSKDANPLTDGICREGLRRAACALERAYRDGSDIEARENMCFASLCGGLALANAKLGAVHGMAGPLGGMFTAPHGAVCGRLLPYVMEANISALKERLPESRALARYDEVARIVSDNFQAQASDGIRWVQGLCDQLQMPPLSEYGINESNFTEIIEKSQIASSMRGNPIRLTDEELQDILQQAAPQTKY